MSENKKKSSTFKNLFTKSLRRIGLIPRKTSKTKIIEEIGKINTNTDEEEEMIRKLKKEIKEDKMKIDVNKKKINSIRKFNTKRLDKASDGINQLKRKENKHLLKLNIQKNAMEKRKREGKSIVTNECIANNLPIAPMENYPSVPSRRITVKKLPPNDFQEYQDLEDEFQEEEEDMENELGDIPMRKDTVAFIKHKKTYDINPNIGGKERKKTQKKNSKKWPI